MVAFYYKNPFLSMNKSKKRLPGIVDLRNKPLSFADGQ